MHHGWQQVAMPSRAAGPAAAAAGLKEETPLLRFVVDYVAQQVVQQEPSPLLDHAHGTVYLSSSPTARHLSPSRNISRLIYLVCLFGARIDCVSALAVASAAYDDIILSNYITLHYKLYNKSTTA